MAMGPATDQEPIQMPETSSTHMASSPRQSSPEPEAGLERSSPASLPDKTQVIAPTASSAAETKDQLDIDTNSGEEIPPLASEDILDKGHIDDSHMDIQGGEAGARANGSRKEVFFKEEEDDARLIGEDEPEITTKLVDSYTPVLRPQTGSALLDQNLFVVKSLTTADAENAQKVRTKGKPGSVAKNWSFPTSFIHHRVSSPTIKGRLLRGPASHHTSVPKTQTHERFPVNDPSTLVLFGGSQSADSESKAKWDMQVSPSFARSIVGTKTSDSSYNTVAGVSYAPGFSRKFRLQSVSELIPARNQHSLCASVYLPCSVMRP